MSAIKENRILPIARLVPHPDNYRAHPDEQIAQLAASLARFGQGRSIVVQETGAGYLIVAGHGVVEAAKQLDYTELRADILPADWTAEQVKGYLIADNELSKNASEDEAGLLALLQEQLEAGFDLASLGSSEDGMATLQLLIEQTTPKEVGESGSTQKGPRPASVSIFVEVAALPTIEQAIAATEEETRGKAFETICAFYLEHYEARQ